MIGVLVTIILIGFVFLLECSKPFIWALKRLRLIYPILFLILCIVCDGKDWVVAKFLEYKLSEDVMIEDILFILICLLSVYFLIKEIVQSIKGFFTKDNND